jgi:hypothetical protein
VSIGAFSLGKKFNGVLAWGLIDNRPFLRCMLGVALCWWRLGKTREAPAVFRKMLWLNSGDNQGSRFNLAAVESRQDVGGDRGGGPKRAAAHAKTQGKAARKARKGNR